MRILIIGHAESVWIKNYIKYIVADGINEIDLFNTGNASEKEQEQYSMMRVNVINFPDNIRTLRCKQSRSFVERLTWLHFCLSCFRKIGANYDVINMQYVALVYFMLLGFVKDIREKLILSFWGSDLLCLSNRQKIIMRQLLKISGCRFVTFDNADLSDVFQKYFAGCKIPRKVIMLPIPLLDEIDNTSVEYRVGGVNLPHDKFIIAVGYNAGKHQQHMKTIEALGKIKDSYKEKVLIVLQMTYGGNSEYISLCREKCIESGLQFQVITDFMTEKDVAALRKRTDIFINAQKTDAFAGSFCEYLYAETLILNAKWLHYREVDMFGISCVEFEEFEELPVIVEKYVDKPDSYQIDFEGNREIVRRLRSVESCKKQWQQLFSFFKNKGL